MALIKLTDFNSLVTAINHSLDQLKLETFSPVAAEDEYRGAVKILNDVLDHISYEGDVSSDLYRYRHEGVEFEIEGFKWAYMPARWVNDVYINYGYQRLAEAEPDDPCELFNFQIMQVPSWGPDKMLVLNTEMTEAGPEGEVKEVLAAQIFNVEEVPAVIEWLAHKYVVYKKAAENRAKAKAEREKQDQGPSIDIQAELKGVAI